MNDPIKTYYVCKKCGKKVNTESKEDLKKHDNCKNENGYIELQLIYKNQKEEIDE